MEDIECPYCEHPQDINHDDGYGYTEGVKHQQECEKCGKQFVFETSISFYYEPEKADCLNDGEHDYQITKTTPNCFSKMRCVMCDEERDLTEDEKIEHKIISYGDYLKSLNLNPQP